MSSMARLPVFVAFVACLATLASCFSSKFQRFSPNFSTKCSEAVSPGRDLFWHILSRKAYHSWNAVFPDSYLELRSENSNFLTCHHFCIQKGCPPANKFPRIFVVKRKHGRKHSIPVTTSTEDCFTTISSANSPS